MNQAFHIGKQAFSAFVFILSDLPTLQRSLGFCHTGHLTPQYEITAASNDSSSRPCTSADIELAEVCLIKMDILDERVCGMKTSCSVLIPIPLCNMLFH